MAAPTAAACFKDWSKKSRLERSELIVTLSALAAASAPVCDRPGWDRLERLNGNWEVSVRYRVAPGNFQDGKAISEFRPGPAPCTLIERTNGEVGGKPMQFLSVVAISHEGAFERAYLDSEHGRILHYTGVAEGSSIAFALDHPASARFKSSATFALGPQSCPRITHRLSTDDGKTWQDVLEFRFSPQTDADRSCSIDGR